MLTNLIASTKNGFKACMTRVVVSCLYKNDSCILYIYFTYLNLKFILKSKVAPIFRHPFLLNETIFKSNVKEVPVLVF